MDLNYLRRLVKIFDDSSAQEISIEEEGIKLKLSKAVKQPKEVYIPQQSAYYNPQQNFHTSESISTASDSIQMLQTAEQNEALKKSEALEKKENLHEIKSPIVGTFYRAPSPDSDAFVEIGSHVTVGQTLCIIEAMKLMNEIESDISGSVIKILVKNGEAIEYNQSLFVIKPD